VEEKGRIGGSRGCRNKRTIEALLVRHVVNQQDTHSATVISSSDGAETLLASSIPDLELDTLAIEFDCADLEVNADGGDE
jgi:hypothetical protein